MTTKDTDSYQHMKSVESCHDIVEAKEKDLAFRTGEEGRRTGVNAVVNLGPPFNAFVHQEQESQNDRGRQ